MQIGNYILDQQQEKVILDESKYLLVTAGAGSGKTLTILGKIYDLINNKNYNPKDILCISFTNAAATNLKEKIKKELNLEVTVYTFHKLGLELLKQSNYQYDIADSNLLEMITEQFFQEEIEKSEFIKKRLCHYFYQSTRNYPKIKEEKKTELKKLEKLIITLIKLIKCNNYQLSDFTIFLRKIKQTINFFTYQREKTILIITINIYLKYEKYLKENQEIDFDDMLLKATEIVRNNNLSLSWKYIIIDEYQDTSYIRFLLIKEIINKVNSNLMVVGDDFQSIYKFTGCDLSLFTNFTNYFPNATILKLERTYRNSQELIKIAGTFVMKNKKQIKKDLYSEKHLKDPIRIVRYKNIKDKFLSLIKKIPPNKKILVLGRNNRDSNLLLSNIVTQKENKIIIKDYENIDITYMTVHKSKGLESDIVIIINLTDQQNGFPNQIKDERITRIVVKNKEKYLYGEERRLFYVALTRTKNEVYLLVPQKSPSIFIEELEYIMNYLEKENNFFRSSGVFNRKS